MKRLALVFLAVGAIGAPAAHAATVKVVVEPPRNGPWAGIEYRAAPGEANRLQTFRESETTVRVEDPGATIVPGAGCTSLDTHTVRCTTDGYKREGLLGANVFVGDLDDVVNSHELGLSANGGPGDDHIESAGPVAGTLNGGGGRDVLLGGTNEDTLMDGDLPGHVDRDVMDGRDGGATVSYANRTAPVFVDIATLAPAGERGEGDVLRSIDHATGGAGDDVLRGDGGFNRFTGGPGDDHLYGLGEFDFMSGGAGDDRLSGGAGDDGLDGDAGADRLLGGEGNDGLSGGPGSDVLRGGAGADYFTEGTASCGAGYDTVSPSAEVDRVARDCELGQAFMRPGLSYEVKGIDFMPYPVRRTGHAVTLEARCPYGDSDGVMSLLPIAGKVRLRAADGAVLGRATIPDRVTDRCTQPFFEDGFVPRFRITVPLNRDGRRLLSRHRAVVTVAWAGRNTPPHPWAITLG